MRIPYSRHGLDTVFDRIVTCAEKSFKKGAFSSALDRIQLASSLQYNLNSKYTHRRLENIAINLANLLARAPKNYEPLSKKVLFYDYYGISNRGLTQQYLDALWQIDGVSLCYVTEGAHTEKTEPILKMVNGHRSVNYELKDPSLLGKIQELYNIIIKERPEYLFYHISPSSPVPIVATYSFKGIKKYLINITDHAFGLGDGYFFDYSIEFRNYGCTVSSERKEYKTTQLLLLPYYPWQESKGFKGFPIETNDKVVLFSGAFLNKIEDSGNTFFHIVRRILQNNTETVMFFAGGGDDHNLKELISSHNLSKRFFLLGNRSDIAEVFKNIDIYIGTYPLGGGLMSQYAAINGKPILAYKTHSIENIVCTKKKMRFVFDKTDDLLLEAKRLIKDKDYREKRGKAFQTLTATQQDFRNGFRELFFNPTGLQDYQRENIDYDAFCQQYLDKINHRKDANLERYIARKCCGALDWRMIINIIINTNIIKRLIKIYGK